MSTDIGLTSLLNVNGTSTGIFVVPGTIGQASPLDFKLSGYSAQYISEFGVFKVDNQSGSINGVTPGQANYAQTVFSSNNLHVLVNGSQAVGSDLYDYGFKGGDLLEFYVVENSSGNIGLGNNLGNINYQLTYFSNPEANKDSQIYLQNSTLSSGATDLAWKEQSVGSSGFLQGSGANNVNLEVDVKVDNSQINSVFNSVTQTSNLVSPLTNSNLTNGIIGLQNNNQTLQFSSVPIVKDNVNNLYVYNVSTTGIGIFDWRTISANGLPSWLNFHDNGNGTGTLIGTPNSSNSNPNITLTVKDAEGLTANQAFTIGINHAPSFSSTPVTEANLGSPYTYNITTTDPDIGDSRTISACSLPSWLSFKDNGNGTATLTGTPNCISCAPIILIVKDAGGLTDTQTFTIGINHAPSFTSTPVTKDNVGSLYTYNITTTDPNNCGYSTISSSTLPSWLSLKDNGNGTATLTGIPNASVSNPNITLTFKDALGLTATQAFTISINHAPSFTSTAITKDNVGSAYTYNITTTDPDVGDTRTISTSTLPSWLTFKDNGNGTATLTGTPNATVSNPNITLTVQDAGGLVSTQVFTIGINHAPTFTSTAVTKDNAGSVYTYNITTTDPDVGDTRTISTSTLPSWLTFKDNGNGTATLTGTPNNSVSNPNITLTVQDAGGLIATQIFTININHAPTFTSTVVTKDNAGSVYTYNITTTDPDVGDTRTISTSTLPSWLTFKDNGNGTATLTGTPNATVSNPNITLTVQDAGGLVSTQAFTIWINHAPTFTSTAVTKDNAGSTYTYNITTTDPDVGDSRTISASTLPSWLTFQDNGNGTATLTGIPNSSVNNPNITLTVQDAGGLTATQIFTIGINHAPTFTSTAITKDNAGSIYTYNITTTDPDVGDTRTISASTLPSWLTFQDNGNGTATLTGTPNATVSNPNITLTVQDAGGLVSTQAFTIGINHAPTFTSTAVTKDNAGSVYTYNIITTDPDVGDTRTISASTLPSWLTFQDNGNGTATLTGTPNATVSNPNITLTVQDAGGLIATQVFTIGINHASTFTSTAVTRDNAGSLYTYNITTTDPDVGDSRTISASTLPSWLTFQDNGNGTATLTGTPNATVSNPNITLTVQDAGGLVSTQAFTININHAPSFTSTAITKDNAGSVYTYNITTTDPDVGDTRTISASTLSSWLTFQDNGDGTATLTGTPNNNQSNPNITLTVQDAGGLTATQAFTININSIFPPRFTSTAVTKDNVGSLYTYNITTTDSNANTTRTINANVLPSWLTFQDNGDGTATLTGTPDNTDSNPNVKLTVQDAGGLTATQTFTIGINHAPRFTSTPLTTAAVNTPYIYNIATTDPDTGDTRTITAINLPNWLTFQDNGDGTATLTGTPGNSDLGSNNVIQLSVKDAGGLTNSQQFVVAPNLTLTESSTNLTEEKSLTIAIPTTPSILSFKLDSSFDASSLTSIKDAVEIALVDSNGNSLVDTIADSREAFFNLSSGESPALGVGTSYDATTHIVTVNLTGINSSTTGKLVFRIVGDDENAETTATVSNLTVTSAASRTQAPVQTASDSSGVRTNGTVPNFSLLTDVTPSIIADYHQTSYNPETNLLYANIALDNIGSYSVDAPIFVAVNNISDPSVSLYKPDGYTPDGLPYYSFSQFVNGNTLDPNQLTSQDALVFQEAKNSNDPQGAKFTYDLVVLAELNAPPVITSQPVTEVISGQTYKYQVGATDPNGDALTYSLVQSAKGMSIDAKTGLISWNTTGVAVGNQQVAVQVDDGHGGVVEQPYTLSVINQPPNRPPYFISTPIVSAVANAPYVYLARAKDPDNNSLTYTLTNAPTGMQIDTNTGDISWTPTAAQLNSLQMLQLQTAANSGSSLNYSNSVNVPVTVEVNDGQGGVADQNFQLNLQTAPTDHPPIIISNPVTNVNNVISSIDSVVFGLKSQAPNSNSPFSEPPTVLYSFNVDGSNFRNIGTVTLNGSQIDADGLAISDKYKLLGFALSSTGSTLISIDPNSAVATQLGTPLIGRQIRGAVFDLNDNLWVVDNTNSELLNLDPVSGSIIKSVALELSGNPLKLSQVSQGLDIAIDSQGKFYMTALDVSGNAVIYNLDVATGELTQLASDPGQQIAGITFSSFDNSNHLLGYQVNYADDIFSYDPNKNYARTDLIHNIIPQFNAGGGDLAAVVHKPVYTYDVQALSPDNVSLNYSLIIAPTGMKIDSNMGEITWEDPIPSTTPYNITVLVQDGQGGFDTQIYQLSVSNTPTGEITGSVFADLDGNGIRGGSGISIPSDPAITLNSIYANNYSAYDLGRPAAIDTTTSTYIDSPQFDPSNPNIITVLTGQGGNSNEAVDQIQVIRGQGDHIIGFGAATNIINISNSDLGLVAYAPNGTLLVGDSNNTLLEFKQGSTQPDKVISFSALNLPLITGVSVVPTNFPGAGEIKLVSWNTSGANTSQFYSATLAPDGNGTYNIESPQLITNIENDAFIAPSYVPAGSPLFDNSSILIGDYKSLSGSANDNARTSAYEVDANGNPIPSTVSSFITDVNSGGGTFDPVTGDYITVAQHNSGYGTDTSTQIPTGDFIVVRGFNPISPTEPGIPNQTVYLDLQNSGHLDPGDPETTTDAQGNYKFTGLSAGTYTVREVLPDGFAYTAPKPSTLYGSNLIQNGSFEQGPNTDNAPYHFVELYTGSTAIPDWTVTGDSVDYVSNGYWQAADGKISIDLSGRANGGVSQTFNTIPGQAYLVRFDLATNNSIQAGQGVPALVQAAGQSATFIGYATGDASNLAYKTHTWQFTANSTSTKIEFDSESTFGPFGPVLDNVSVSQIISQNDFKQIVNLTSGAVASGVDFGNSRTQQQTISNIPTFISSNAPAKAVVDEEWRYAAAAIDADNSPLTYELIAKPDGMTIDPTTGLIFWRPSLAQSTGSLVNLFAQSGVYDITIGAEDGKGGLGVQNIQVQVVGANSTPVFTSLPTNLLTAAVNTPFQYQFQALDTPGNTVTYSLGNPINGAVIDPKTGIFTWTPSSNQAGNNALTIVATDNQGETTTQSLAIQVVNSTTTVVPTITSQPSKSIILGQTYSYILKLTNPNNYPLSYSLDNAPQGMIIDQQGQILWQPQPNQIGSNSVSIKINDGQGDIISQEFDISVISTPVRSNQPPSITSTPTLIAVANQAYEYKPTASDPDNAALVWGLVASPSGMEIDPQSGTILWTPTTSQLGNFNVTVRVQDSLGAYNDQAFSLSVEPVGTPPLVTSVPVTQAVVNQPYQYIVSAADAQGYPLTYELTQFPTGMTVNAQTGLIQWTPQGAGSYNVSVLVTDNYGNATPQTYKVVVGTSPIYLPPTITSSPEAVAAIGSPYTYKVQGKDPQGQQLTYQLIDAGGANGMSIDPNTGILTWTNPVLGNYQVVVGAVDTAGLGAAQGFTLTARANTPPVISSTPGGTIYANQAYRYDIQAVDPQGGQLTYSIDKSSTVPQGLSLDSQGRLSWTPTASQAGSYSIELDVTNSLGTTTSQTVNLNVALDTVAPVVTLIANNSQVNLGSEVDFQARATDNVQVANLRVLINGQAVVIDANGIARVTASAYGTITGEAIATDEAGNTAQAEFDVAVIDPTNTDSPVVSLDLSSIPNDVVTAPTNILGTVTGDGIEYYTLSIAPVSSSDFQQIARVDSPGAINDGVLGQFDPTLLENGSYTLRLTAYNTGGSSSSTDDTISVAGNLKLGNFHLSFTDLSIPVTGIPITLTRSYDSLTANESEEFGYGWRLDFRDTDLQTSVGQPTGDTAELGGQNPFKNGTRVYITLPGGTREGFTFTPVEDKLSQLFGVAGLSTGAYTTYDPAFVADAGVTDTLTVQDATIQQGLGTDGYYGVSGEAYNPADSYFGGIYTLTTKEGIVYQIDAESGKLLSVTDNNGNKLTYTDAGIYSSTGQDVTFGRDAQGRITSVTDPMGKEILYGYDSQGNLISMTDRDGNVTKFVYDSTHAHYLDQVIDPLGRTGERSNYDASGRLEEIIDANGNPVQFAYDPTDSKETVTDALGNPTTYVYDDRGNVLTKVDALGGVTTSTYDDNNNLLSLTDPDGNTYTYTYDSANNLINVTDPLGNQTRYTFNEFGEILTDTDGLGSTITYTYDSYGNRLSLTNAVGNTIKTSFDSTGRVSEITDANNNTTQFQYDSLGNLVTEIDALGNQTTYTYDGNGNQLTETQTVTLVSGLTTATTSWTYDANNHVTSTTDPAGNVTQEKYDALGNLIAETDPLGNTTQYIYDAKDDQIKTIYADGTYDQSVYDAAGNEIATIDQAGNTTNFVYDALGRLVKTIYPDTTPNDLTDNPTTSTVYDAAGRVTAQVDELGNKTTYTYDADGHTIMVQDALGNKTTYTYDAIGDKLSETDALNHSTYYTYDALGRPIQTRFADGSTTSVTYNAAGKASSSTDQENRTTDYTYDALNRIIGTTDPMGDRTTYTYDELGRLISETDANNNTTKYEYDILGQRTAMIDALGNRTTYTYDADGNQLTETDPLIHTTETVYDVMDRPVETIYSDGSHTNTTYDMLGQKVSETDQMGMTTSYEYDPLGRLTTVIDALQQHTSYSYDMAGNLISQTDANGHTTSYQYNALNEEIATILPLGQKSTTTYDAVGNVLSTTDANGQTTNYQYDSLNRLTQEEFADGSTISYTYTATGKQSTVTDANGVTTYTYDNKDRLLSRTDPDGTKIQYTYDPVGNVTSVTTPSGTTSYTFDALNQMVEVTSSTQGATKYTYDAAGNLIETDLPNTVVESRSYDSLNRLISVEDRNASGLIASYHYTLDASGMRTAVDELGGGHVQYTYDALYRLTEEAITDPVVGDRSTTFTYDAVGNRLTSNDSIDGVTIYIYDANDRLLSQTLNGQTTTFTYDNNGNTLSEYTSATNYSTYTWNDLNGMVTATVVNSTGTHEMNYRYNSDGILVAEVVDEQETRYLIDANRPYAEVVEEYSPDGSIQASYVYGNELISQSRSGTESVFGKDGLDSIRFLTNTNGTVTDTYNYDAFGDLIASTGSTVNYYRFAGERYDVNLGQYYLRSRYYQPDIGRFTRMDSFTGMPDMPLSLNKYLYTDADPVNGVDPSGMFTGSLGELATGAIEDILENETEAVAVVGTVENAALTQIFPESVSSVVPGLVNIARSPITITIGGSVALAVGAAMIRALAPIGEEIENENTGLPIIIWGTELPETTQHTFDAITGSNMSGFKDNIGQASPFLWRYKQGEPDRNWYKNSSFTGKTLKSGLDPTNNIRYSIDEYPYASTIPGGKYFYLLHQVSIRSVPEYEQKGKNPNPPYVKAQGPKLNSFYSEGTGAGVIANDPIKGFFGVFITTQRTSFFIKRDGEIGEFGYE